MAEVSAPESAPLATDPSTQGEETDVVESQIRAPTGETEGESDRVAISNDTNPQPALSLSGAGAEKSEEADLPTQPATRQVTVAPAQEPDALFEPPTQEIIEEQDEDGGWLSDLNVEDITKKKNTMDRYSEACKVLGIVPVSYIAQRLNQSELTVKHHGLGPNGARALGEVLEGNTAILSLDLTNNAIGSGGAHFGRSLQMNHALVYLNLSDNQLGAEGGKEIAEMLTVNFTLQKLILRGNKFTDKEATQFGAGLRSNSSLQELDLSHNDIGDLGVIALGAALAGNDTLKDINLAWNVIRMKGFAGFFSHVKDNNVLSRINMESNGLGDNGSPIGQLLSKNNVLASLNLGKTRMGDAAISAIAKSIEANHGLRELDVSDNPFTDAGALALFKACSASPSLQKVLIRNLKIKREARVKLEELRQEKPHLSMIEV